VWNAIRAPVARFVRRACAKGCECQHVSTMSLFFRIVVSGVAMSALAALPPRRRNE
jgi:hypothetical protein